MSDLLSGGVVRLSAIDRERFNVTDRRIDDLGDFVLVVPNKAMFDWQPGEEPLRSLLCRPDGRVVSAGFPKFFNLGERPDHDAVAREAAVAGLVRYGEKLDGSLIIRSVIDGRVIFRTRGSHELGEFEAPVMRLVRERHARLLDPEFRPDRSLLMEYTGPDNQVVIRYDEARLSAIAEVCHEGVCPMLPDFGAACGLGGPREEICGTRPHTLTAVAATVRDWTGDEGVVAWCFREAGPPVLLKIKSAEYLKLHALRSALNERRVWMLCAMADAETVDAGRAAMEAIGLDWESFAYAEPWIRSYLARRAANRAAVRALVQAARGDIARGLRAAAEKIGRSDLFGAALHGALGEVERVRDLLMAADVEMPVNALRAEREQTQKALSALLGDGQRTRHLGGGR